MGPSSRKIAAALLAIGALSARGQLTATADTVDFGTIREAEGPKTVRMYVRNDGDRPTAILKVRPTCGCTAADFMKEEIAPGDSAWIDLTYDPERRPGAFLKAVKIYPTDSEEDPGSTSGKMIRVTIAGTVFASPETIASMFPIDAGELHLSADTLMTLSPLRLEKRTLWLDVYNSGDQPVWVSMETDSPAITYEAFPTPVLPGEKGMIGVHIDPIKEKRTGKIEYELTLQMNEDGTYPIRLITENPRIPPL